MRTIDEIKAEIKRREDEIRDVAGGKDEYSIDRINYNKAILYELENEYRSRIMNGIGIDRLEQICAAEKDGRCVILPCDIGDMVWFIKSMFKYLESPISATIYMFKCFKNNEITFCAHQNEIERIFKIDDIGKTVFLTKQQAEEKLAELNAGK